MALSSHHEFQLSCETTAQDKKYYRNFILNLQHTLPCKHCRINLKNNLKAHPLKMCHMKNRQTFLIMYIDFMK